MAFVEPYGSAAYAFVDVPDLGPALIGREQVVAGIDPHLRIAPGEPVSLSVNPDRLTLFDPGTGAAILHRDAGSGRD